MRPVARTVSESGKPAVIAAARATDGTLAVLGLITGAVPGIWAVPGEGRAAATAGDDSHGWQTALIAQCLAPHGSEWTVSKL